MKLRLKGNSIRLRLTQAEVGRLTSAGRVEEVVGFGPGERTFVYALAGVPDIDSIRAEYDQDKMTVRVPERQVREWAASEEIGIEAGAGDLQIVIEKDFACLKPRPGEDESEMFPNPNSHC